jgi:hypothetical protein
VLAHGSYAERCGPLARPHIQYEQRRVGGFEALCDWKPFLDGLDATVRGSSAPAVNTAKAKPCSKGLAIWSSTSHPGGLVVS